MKTPQRAHRPQMNFPKKVLGWENRGDYREVIELRCVHLEVISHCGQGHQAPPDTVVERPVRGLRTLLLEGKDEAGEHEDGHHEHQDDQAQLLGTRKLS